MRNDNPLNATILYNIGSIPATDNAAADVPANISAAAPTTILLIGIAAGVPPYG